jgi:hypothetical protein
MVGGATDDIGSGAKPGDSGWGVKVWNGVSTISTETPTTDNWEDKSFGDPTLVDTLDTPTEYHPFWIYIVSPPVTQMRVQNKQNIGLYLTYIETA